jgi:hypothetical protein
MMQLLRPWCVLMAVTYATAINSNDVGRDLHQDVTEKCSSGENSFAYDISNYADSVNIGFKLELLHKSATLHMDVRQNAIYITYSNAPSKTPSKHQSNCNRKPITYIQKQALNEN